MAIIVTVEDPNDTEVWENWVRQVAQSDKPWEEIPSHEYDRAYDWGHPSLEQMITARMGLAKTLRRLDNMFATETYAEAAEKDFDEQNPHG